MHACLPGKRTRGAHSSLAQVFHMQVRVPGGDVTREGEKERGEGVEDGGMCVAASPLVVHRRHDHVFQHKCEMCNERNKG